MTSETKDPNHSDIPEDSAVLDSNSENAPTDPPAESPVDKAAGESRVNDGASAEDASTSGATESQTSDSQSTAEQPEIIVPEKAAATPRGSHLFFRRVKLTSSGRYFSLELRPALHAVVLEAETDAQKFIESASGISFPARGSVTFGRTSPGKSPSLRKNIGSLLPWEPPLLKAPTVRHHIAHVLSLRQELGAEGLSDPNQVPFVQNLLDLSPESLSVHDRRRVALGLAFSLTRPIALLLSDPLGAVTDEEIPLVLSHLHEQEAAGATIACVVASHRGASLLTTRIHSILSEFPRSESGAYFLLRSERPRELASLLASDPNILSTRVHPEIAGELSVEALSEEAGAKAITSAVAHSGVTVFEMRRTTRSQWSIAP